MAEMRHNTDWLRFSDQVYAHVKATFDGHYARRGAEMEPIDFFEAYLDPDWLVGQVCKYVLRVQNSHNEKDLLKAAHYLSRLHVKLFERS